MNRALIVLSGSAHYTGTVIDEEIARKVNEMVVVLARLGARKKQEQSRGANTVKTTNRIFKKSTVAQLIFCSVVSAATGHLLGGKAKAQSLSLERVAENEAIVHDVQRKKAGYKFIGFYDTVFLKPETH